ncbi:nacrein-like protein C1, partial [Temnothorax curvispinosus]|uniref:Nacrein-like protein C1 n=1 Tax=Temnothorax curvispinosus TaxID=300111 RepID=A0A6J1RDD0_9HYME
TEASYCILLTLERTNQIKYYATDTTIERQRTGSSDAADHQSQAACCTTPYGIDKKKRDGLNGDVDDGLNDHPGSDDDRNGPGGPGGDDGSDGPSGPNGDDGLGGPGDDDSFRGDNGLDGPGGDDGSGDPDGDDGDRANRIN